MTTVAIHQPNYLPWLGYFYKMAQSDVFVFLDDAQFSKNSYINRSRILGPGGPRWLTLPVSYGFGDAIASVRVAETEWRSRHLDSLLTSYRSARCFREVWPAVQKLYDGIPDGGLASINRRLVEGLATRLGISCRFEASSQFATDGLTSDDRLVALVAVIDRQGTYVSGRGGAGYQDPAKFAAAGLKLRYSDFEHPTYDQSGSPFVEGLSVVDAICHLGWKGASELILRGKGEWRN